VPVFARWSRILRYKLQVVRNQIGAKTRNLSKKDGRTFHPDSGSSFQDEFPSAREPNAQSASGVLKPSMAWPSNPMSLFDFRCGRSEPGYRRFPGNRGEIVHVLEWVDFGRNGVQACGAVLGCSFSLSYRYGVSCSPRASQNKGRGFWKARSEMRLIFFRLCR
jgi:hypothetical protein